MLRFRINYEKCIQGIALLAAHKPGITQYYIGKVFFFADEEHLLDWGRPISGDQYVAMEHGPVPSVIYDLLKEDAGLPDEVNDEVDRWVKVVSEGNRREVFVRGGVQDWPALSEAERECLLKSLREYGSKSFSELRRLTHEERAYRDAWDSGPRSAPMDYEKLVPDSFEDRPAFVAELRERAAFELA